MLSALTQRACLRLRRCDGVAAAALGCPEALALLQNRTAREVDTAPGSVILLREVGWLAGWLGWPVADAEPPQRLAHMTLSAPCALPAWWWVQPWRVIPVEGSQWPAVLCYAVSPG